MILDPTRAATDNNGSEIVTEFQMAQMKFLFLIPDSTGTHDGHTFPWRSDGDTTVPHAELTSESAVVSRVTVGNNSPFNLGSFKITFSELCSNFVT